jgi:hypothetical protein
MEFSTPSNRLKCKNKWNCTFLQPFNRGNQTEDAQLPGSFALQLEIPLMSTRSVFSEAGVAELLPD